MGAINDAVAEYLAARKVVRRWLQSHWPHPLSVGDADRLAASVLASLMHSTPPLLVGFADTREESE